MNGGSEEREELKNVGRCQTMLSKLNQTRENDMNSFSQFIKVQT